MSNFFNVLVFIIELYEFGRECGTLFVLKRTKIESQRFASKFAFDVFFLFFYDWSHCWPTDAQWPHRRLLPHFWNRCDSIINGTDDDESCCCFHGYFMPVGSAKTAARASWFSMLPESTSIITSVGMPVTLYILLMSIFIHF